MSVFPPLFTASIQLRLTGLTLLPGVLTHTFGPGGLRAPPVVAGCKRSWPFLTQLTHTFFFFSLFSTLSFCLDCFSPKGGSRKMNLGMTPYFDLKRIYVVKKLRCFFTAKIWLLPPGLKYLSFPLSLFFPCIAFHPLWRYPGSRFVPNQKIM